MPPAAATPTALLPAVATFPAAASTAALAATATAVDLTGSTTPSRLVVESPIGRILLLGDGQHIVRLEIEGVHGFHSPEASAVTHTDAVLTAAATQLHEYFHAGRRTFTVPVRLRGTEFQQQIWQQLLEIPWGETRTYGQLGIASGRPSAGRAVGGAVGANPVPLLVPCHRVLAGDQRITGYSAGAGVPTKVHLLDLEGIAHR